MKLYKMVCVIVLFIAVSLTAFAVYAKNSPNTSPKTVNGSNTSSPDSNDTLLSDSSKALNTEEIKNIVRKTDSQVQKVNDRLSREFYEDHYDGDVLMYRYFERGVAEQDAYVEYCLYYDEQGKLIYADITHYRGALYSIYFYDDKLLHVEVGPFVEGGSSINGDMEHVKAVIKKDSDYSFVLEDSSLCLENAYK